MLDKVGPFEPGQPVRAAWLQTMLVALKKLMNFTAVPPLRFIDTPSGIGLALGNIAEAKRFKVKSLISLTKSTPSLKLIGICKEVTRDGTEMTGDVPVWLRPDVKTEDIILALKPVTGTGVTYTTDEISGFMGTPGDEDSLVGDTFLGGDEATTLTVAVMWMQPEACSPGNFAVKVEKTSGSNSTSPSTTASYGYTARLIAWTGSGTSVDFELGTSLAPNKPREKGDRGFQSGTTGYGIAFYAGSTLVLWDAGETVGGEECEE